MSETGSNEWTFIEEYKKKLKDDSAEKKFIDDHFREICECFIENSDFERDSRFLEGLIDFLRCKYDFVYKYISIIKRQVGASFLMKNSYICNHFDSFVDVIIFERSLEEKVKDFKVEYDSISLEDVYRLTEDFLKIIDSSPDKLMLDEFRMLKESGKIIINQSDWSKYDFYDGVIYFAFDGTTKTCYDLVHEFLHHWVQKVNPNVIFTRDGTSLLYEYVSIYFEIVFGQYVNQQKGYDKPLFISRLQDDYKKDLNNVLIMYIELVKLFMTKESIDKVDIISVLKKYISDYQNEEDLLKKGSELLGSRFSLDLYSRIVYRFCSGLARMTPSFEAQDMAKVISLIPFIGSSKDDDSFMKQWELLFRERNFKLKH